MNENIPNNIEQNRPLTPEQIEAIRQRQETLEQANEVLTAKEKAATERGVPFAGPPSDKLASEVAEATRLNTPAPEVVEHKVSDKTQEFINRLESSKSAEEAVGIMNEVLQASKSGQIPPDEATELLNRAG